MKWEYNTTILRSMICEIKAKRKVPKFAFEYLDGGCNEDVNLYKNTAELREVELLPYYLDEHQAFGYDKLNYLAMYMMHHLVLRRLACRD